MISVRKAVITVSVYCDNADSVPCVQQRLLGRKIRRPLAVPTDRDTVHCWPVLIQNYAPLVLTPESGSEHQRTGRLDHRLWHDTDCNCNCNLGGHRLWHDTDCNCNWGGHQLWHDTDCNCNCSGHRLWHDTDCSCNCNWGGHWLWHDTDCSCNWGGHQFWHDTDCNCNCNLGGHSCWTILLFCIPLWTGRGSFAFLLSFILQVYGSFLGPNNW